jgi:hypothetical protein
VVNIIEQGKPQSAKQIPLSTKEGASAVLKKRVVESKEYGLGLRSK